MPEPHYPAEQSPISNFQPHLSLLIISSFSYKSVFLIFKLKKIEVGFNMADTKPSQTIERKAVGSPSKSHEDVTKPDQATSHHHHVDKTRPQDFDGEVMTTNELPSPVMLEKIKDYIVLDKDGKSYAFKTLYSGSHVARRVLVIFIRHFFCGVRLPSPFHCPQTKTQTLTNPQNCQDYLRTLSESISPSSLLRLPVSTFIVVIGCGDPSLIPSYAEASACRFPIYTDPKRQLFGALGMSMTLAFGEKPGYMKRPMTTSVIASIGQALRALPSGMTLKSGNQRQVGGEFLFEPLEIDSPGVEERKMTLPDGESAEDNVEGGVEGSVEEKRVSWCHRMKTTRDHAEMPELFEVLGLDRQGRPIEDRKMFEEALLKRKGFGLGVQMGELGQPPAGKTTI